MILERISVCLEVNSGNTSQDLKSGVLLIMLQVYWCGICGTQTRARGSKPPLTTAAARNPSLCSPRITPTDCSAQPPSDPVPSQASSPSFCRRLTLPSADPSAPPRSFTSTWLALRMFQYSPSNWGCFSLSPLGPQDHKQKLCFPGSPVLRADHVSPSLLSKSLHLFHATSF